ncbi:eukaryotic translation initiation factor 2A-like [Limulus polyphemus]|uniref:Eukaryotic translation initiation factor 2A n=1 Tax=Limulus polyphemus TaxID=6850 RepID=A0ABM1BSN6_LIMPO|nr:eukaryotic translation initiation factor 2A-like [Limulus polyphemus]
MAASMPLISVRGSDGLHLTYGPPNYNEYETFEKDTSKICRVMAFSQDGKYFAWSNGSQVKVISLPSCSPVLQIAKPKTTCLQFSPTGDFIITWEPYSAIKENPRDNSNLHIWEVKSGTCLHSFIQKKQYLWYPQWSIDEKICARNVNNEVHFFENNVFTTITKKIFLQKVSEFSLAPGPPPYHIACYVPGSKGQPSFVRLYRYPPCEGNSSVIANKSFFKADKVEFNWNKKGTGLLLLTSTDVDKTGASYYGEQLLHYLGTSGDTSIVKLAKDGPIYSIDWSPRCNEFCVVYGFMPAKATIFNLKCEPVFDFGTGPRNAVYYNSHGNMLILAGFGNLRGNVEVWDMKAKKLVTQTQASDSTFLSWCPDGEHILTATTSPRLRVANGYRVWHYTGSLLFERRWDSDQELWEVCWQPCPFGTFPETEIKYTPVAGIETPQAQVTKQAYRPPALRGKPSTFKLHDDDEPPSNKKQSDQTIVPLSKSAQKNKKKKEAKKAKKEQEKVEERDENQPGNETSPVYTEADGTETTGDPEKDKKIRNIKKKLDQISKLKAKEQEGKTLELNQVTD